jgi:hypothetical protein
MNSRSLSAPSCPREKPNNSPTTLSNTLPKSLAKETFLFPGALLQETSYMAFTDGSLRDDIISEQYKQLIPTLLDHLNRKAKIDPI